MIAADIVVRLSTPSLIAPKHGRDRQLGGICAAPTAVARITITRGARSMPEAENCPAQSGWEGGGDD